MPDVVLIFGEDFYDCQTMMYILSPFIGCGIRPKPQRMPQSFIDRDVAQKRNLSNAERIGRTIAAAAVKNNIRAVIIHKDCDACEPEHEPLREAIRRELSGVGIDNAVPAVPAWETEAWLMLFPEAFAFYRPCWNQLNIGQRNVGMIPNAKEFLRRSLRSDRRGCRDYRESDAPGVAEIATVRGLVTRERIERSSALREFIDEVEDVLSE